jgi:hypothetical protein
MIEALNIVSFDVPFPPNYGGVIDVFHKIRTFHRLGVKIHLHCFEYGRGIQPELEKYCESVTYYKRKTAWYLVLSRVPYIILTRKSKELKKSLLSNNFPILMEGLHTCYLLKNNSLKNRTTIYRESNIEHRYYLHLASSERNLFKKLYLYLESRKLKRFEKEISNATLSCIVSQTDFHYLEMKYPNNQNYFIPSFHQNEQVTIPEGKGKFVLYHGNLSVSENYEAAIHLIRKVFATIRVPFIIAGLNPPDFLISEVEKHDHITLFPNASKEKMTELMENAHIHLLYTNQATGLKLKLLNVLYHGRHCMVNSKMVEGTSLGEVCEVVNSPDQQMIRIKQLMEVAVERIEVEKRRKVLEENYSNQVNAERMLLAIEENLLQ